MGSAQIWREIKQIRGKFSQPKVINPKEEANKKAHHFATRADSPFIPHELETVLSTPKKLRPWRRQIYIHLSLQISPLFQS